jgi:predicted nucleotidyltransferase
MKESREEDVMELFFNEPTKHWHFEEIAREVGITRSKADKWLKRFVKESLIKRVKERKKMPYYISNYNLSNYQNKKRLFAFKKLYETGFLNHLSSLKKARTIIIFGSFTRWDWYKESDIDLFIYGNPEGLSIGRYEINLHRDIQVFICKNLKELKKLGKGLIRNIIKGDIIKGDIQFLKVTPYA